MTLRNDSITVSKLAARWVTPGSRSRAKRRFDDPERRFEISPIGAGDRVLATVVGAKQLVGTIEKVETHQPDPTSNGETDPWDAAALEWRSLKDRLWSTYRQAASDAGPTEEEIKEALPHWPAPGIRLRPPSPLRSATPTPGRA